MSPFGERPTEESDQLPEEAPAEQVPDDDGGASSSHAADRERDDESPGVPGEEGQATGNPDNAG